ncbi:hypothetical protein R1flu_009883 [Riccia fluitans]|uniref:Uncharacterized protein n=1 Tax=Riccia fluitans TaxID=41844 RepID=A0ABD1Z3F1_9MARC
MTLSPLKPTVELGWREASLVHEESALGSSPKTHCCDRVSNLTPGSLGERPVDPSSNYGLHSSRVLPSRMQGEGGALVVRQPIAEGGPPCFSRQGLGVNSAGEGGGDSVFTTRDHGTRGDPDSTMRRLLQISLNKF